MISSRLGERMYECYERSPTPNRPEGAAWGRNPNCGKL
ncbi:hypothetical protein I552_5408 [Mycobacterium xenopi 3993]|nr:hypothetical protein I552_5408 [Mycobacterium xenopi 3993]